MIVFPSPVGVRPLTLTSPISDPEDQKIVSVPCWGKAINTAGLKMPIEDIEEVVSVPCWGKAINTSL